MGEEVEISEYADEGSDGSGDEGRIFEWESGLPSGDDLTPLSQPLVPPELASAFSISTEPCRTEIDVNRASNNTLSSLRRLSNSLSSNNFKCSVGDQSNNDREKESLVVENDDLDRDASDSRKIRRVDCVVEEADSALCAENPTDDQSARTIKRPRLVWTPQLHKRFVDVVAHLGIKNAVPKTIMQLMNVEGLTRENVASHLQKYRLYLKRLSNEGSSSSDQLFASTPVPQTLHESNGSGGHRNRPVQTPIPVPYASPMIPLPVLGVAPGHGHMGTGKYHGFESHYPYHTMQQSDWSGNKFGSAVSYPQAANGQK